VWGIVFFPSELQMITFDHIDIGVISLLKKKEEIFLRAIEILPQYQSRGIGTWIWTFDKANKPSTVVDVG